MTTPAGAPARAADEPIPRPVWRLALVIAFGAFMSQLDTSVVNVGLGTIATDLHAELADAQWVANAYLIALGLSLPACGWLGRRYGAGRVWLVSLAGFTLTSGMCALAGGIGWLVAFRVAQGLTAGLLLPAGQTVLGQAVGPHRLGRVMASLGIAVTLAPALGPAFGGLVLDLGSWPWLFLVNLPLGALGLCLGLRHVPRARPPVQPGSLDWPGLLLVAAGVPLLIYGLSAWGERGAASEGFGGALGPVAAGALALAAFAWHARRTAHPVLDLRLFANRAYAAATATAALTGAAMFGATLLFPLYFQIGRDTGVTGTGLALIPLGLGTALLLPLSGRLVDRLGGGVVSVYGGLATVVTTLPFALLDTDVNVVAVEVLLLLRGMALALAVTPPGIAAYQAVASEQLPDATTQVNILQRLGGALGGTVFAVVLAGKLPHGVDGAFHAAFWWLTAASVLGLGSAAWLAAAQRRDRRAEAG
ncbi:MFS transporter [Microbispora rosea subsp. aerata]|nr:DHA2 family efflux MFS transporter permease subunit [Microbispora rosea]GGO10860.1 MFS transporter [Microbispora rosea subsp. aerata]GIH53634.1 MFS transporter [Microbispora rosea subsp. aerata]GLJ86235.1 MFS transporter [Microbispora rosea subsp. aerata]